MGSFSCAGRVLAPPADLGVCCYLVSWFTLDTWYSRFNWFTLKHCYSSSFLVHSAYLALSDTVIHSDLLVLSRTLVHSFELVLSGQMAHFLYLALSSVLIHSWTVALSICVVHSCPLLLSANSVHSLRMVRSHIRGALTIFGSLLGCVSVLCYGYFIGSTLCAWPRMAMAKGAGAFLPWCFSYQTSNRWLRNIFTAYRVARL